MTRNRTVYVGTVTASGPDLLSVFNGATCDATDTSGCNQVPATLAFGDSGGAARQLLCQPGRRRGDQHPLRDEHRRPPLGGLGWRERVHGQRRHLRCHRHLGVRTGAGNNNRRQPRPARWAKPLGIAVDDATDTVYAALKANGDYAGTVAVINGATCDGEDTTGCGNCRRRSLPGSASMTWPSTAPPATSTSRTTKMPACQ